MLKGQRFLGATRNTLIVTCAATVITLLLLLLSACGANAGGQGLTTTPLHIQKCGAIHSMHSQIAPADQNTLKQTENCFWQAFQQCHPATLTYALNGLDFGTVHTFILKNANGKCVITDGIQHYIAPHPLRKATTYTCSDVKIQPDGLYVFSCDDAGTVIVPSK